MAAPDWRAAADDEGEAGMRTSFGGSGRTRRASGALVRRRGRESGQSWIHMMTNSLGGPGRMAHRIAAAGCHAGPMAHRMRVVEVDQAVREVREHCDSLDRPRVVTSGNFAAPVTLLGPLLAELPAARLHALNAQQDLPMHDGVVPETTFVGPRLPAAPAAGLRPLPAVDGAAALPRAAGPGRRRGAHHDPARRPGVARARGQRAAGRHRGGPGAGCARGRPAQPADAVDLRRRGAAARRRRPRGGGRRPADHPPRPRRRATTPG